MNFKKYFKKIATALVASSMLGAGVTTTLFAQAATAKKPNIVVIMGDDIGWFNLGS